MEASSARYKASWRLNRSLPGTPSAAVKDSNLNAASRWWTALNIASLLVATHQTGGLSCKKTDQWDTFQNRILWLKPKADQPWRPWARLSGSALGFLPSSSLSFWWTFLHFFSKLMTLSSLKLEQPVELRELMDSEGLAQKWNEHKKVILLCYGCCSKSEWIEKRSGLFLQWMQSVTFGPATASEMSHKKCQEMVASVG